jgi:hypothetical protein
VTSTLTRPPVRHARIASTLRSPPATSITRNVRFSCSSAMAMTRSSSGPCTGAPFRSKNWSEMSPTAPRFVEVYPKINGGMVYLWRVVNAEGEVLDALVRYRRQASLAEIDAQASEEICLRAQAVHNRRLAVLPRRCRRSWPQKLAPAWARQEQSIRELPSPDAPTGAENTTLQEPWLSSKISLERCCRLQHLQHPTPSRLPSAHRVLRAAVMNAWRDAVAAT